MIKKSLVKLSAVLTAAAVFAVTAFFAISAPVTANAATLSVFAGTVKTSSTSLNVRSGAGTDYSVVASVKKGGYITLLSKSGNWWKVEYASGKYGYCHADYINKVSSTAAVVNTAATNLNVRSGAGKSYGVIGSVAKGKQVAVLSESGGWSKILFNGVRTGYVSGSYLKKVSSYQKISLDVPDYKQTDARWKNAAVGKSGKTIGTVGCTTAAVAMMESYRQGKTIYPDAMAKKLSYSSSGDLYWPSDYVINTDSSGYLNRIYSLLSAGKPVLIGAKNSSGKQHWVVVTGYKGGDSLAASKFTINDPGSSSRTNLKQFLNDYPQFYKTVCY